MSTTPLLGVGNEFTSSRLLHFIGILREGKWERAIRVNALSIVYSVLYIV